MVCCEISWCQRPHLAIRTTSYCLVRLTHAQTQLTCGMNYIKGFRSSGIQLHGSADSD
jgi:hypothetical protein